MRHDQWWECKFLAEGIIDQGGGFRDSLSDLADELCPSANDVPVPLSFFIRTPNQVSSCFLAEGFQQLADQETLQQGVISYIYIVCASE